MKDITSLRNHLFDALNRLAEASSEELESEIMRSSSIVQVSEAIIKTAEVENNFIAITKAIGSGFIPILNDKKSLFEIVKEQNEKKKELFDVDKEKNWLADQGDPHSNDNNVSTSKIGTIDRGE